jgi:hypothetical protein
MTQPHYRRFQDRLCPRPRALQFAALYLALLAIFLYNFPHRELLPLAPLLLLLAYAAAVLLANIATHAVSPQGIATTHGPLPALSPPLVIPAGNIHSFYFRESGPHWSAGVRTEANHAFDLLTRLESSEQALALARELAAAVNPALPVTELDPATLSPPPASYTQLLCWLGALLIALAASGWLASI